MNYQISQEGFDKLSRIPTLLVSGCEEPQVEEAKALAEAVVGMAQPVEQDMSSKPPSALHVGGICQTALHVGGVASQPQSEQEQVRAAIEAGHYSSYVRLWDYGAQRAWTDLAWEEAEAGELRVYYAYADGLEYRACLDANGELEQVQVRADPRLLATRSELAEAEAGREDHANGYQRLWNALWDVRERCERSESCTANLLIEVINNVQQAELNLSKWPSKALATAQEVQK